MNKLIFRFASLLAALSILFTSCISRVTYVSQDTPIVRRTKTATVTTRPKASKTPARPSATPTKDPSQALNAGKSGLNGLTIQVWYGLDARQAEVLQKIASEFNAQNTWGLTVKLTGYPNLNELVSTVEDISITRPDAVLALPEHLVRWDEQTPLVDLTPYLNHPEFGFSKTDQADFPAAFLEQDLLGTRRIGMPGIRAGRFLFYNQTWARELGFTTPPATAEDFRKQACAANASFKTDTDLTNDGYGGWVFDGDPWTAYSWIKAFGGDVYDGEKYQFNTQENTAAITFLKDMRDDGCIWVTTDLTPYDHLPKRTALFVTGNLSAIQAQQMTMLSANSTDTWSVIPFPGKKPAIAVYGPSFGVFESSLPRQLAAWLFIRWMSTPESQARWAKATGLLPARISAAGQVTSSSANPQWSAAAGYAENMVSYPHTGTWSLARNVLGDGFSSYFILNQSLDQIKKLLEKMNETMEDVLTKE